MKINVPSAWQNEAKRILLAAWKTIRHNLGFKLMAFFLAVALWAGLISQDSTLTREKNFEDVTISISGAETIKRNGFIVLTDLSELVKGAQMEVEVPQLQYQNASVANYNPRIDLSRINQTGTQELRVQTTTSTIYGSVTEIQPSSITVVVEEYVTRYRIPVTMNVTGKAPESFYAYKPTVDPSMVAISGPKSLVDKVVRAETVVDLAQLPAREGEVRQAAPFRLLDAEGNEVVSDMIEVTSESVLLDSVVVQQQVYSAREINLADVGLVQGTPAEGYEVKSVTVTPAAVTVAGSAAALERLDAVYSEGSVSVEGLKESTNVLVRMRRPSGISYLSSDSVTVAVEIGPVIRSKTFGGIRIKFTGLANGLQASANTSSTDVTVQGAQLWVNKLKKTQITLTCDLSGLTPGEYELPLQFDVSGSEGQSFSVEMPSASVTVTITEK